MDEMADKQNMIKMLLEMLKGSASDEVMGGLKAPEPMLGDMPPVDEEMPDALPLDGEAPKPEEPAPEPSMADSIMKKGEPAAEEAEAGLEDEEEETPAFSSFMKRKK